MALALTDLISPRLLTGFSYPDQVAQILDALEAQNVTTFIDEQAVVYYGKAVVSEENLGKFTGVIDLGDAAALEFPVGFDFRLTVPRDGSDLIKDVVDPIASVRKPLQDLLADLGQTNLSDGDVVIPTEYPGFQFKLELVFSSISLVLKEWHPGILDEATGKIRRATAADASKFPNNKFPSKVQISLPQFLVSYTQSDDFQKGVQFELESWGFGGFHAPSDLDMGELIRMEPSIAIDNTGRYGFGFDKLLLDLSEESTPPELLAKFAIDEAFKGIYIQDAHFFYHDRDKNFELTIGLTDLMIDFSGYVSFLLEADFFGNDSLSLQVNLYDSERKRIKYSNQEVETTDKDGYSSLTKYSGGKPTFPDDGLIEVISLGGTLPYEIVTAKYEEEPLGVPEGETNTDSLRRTYKLPGTSTESNNGTILIELIDNKLSAKKTKRNKFSQRIDIIRVPKIRETNTSDDGLEEDGKVAASDRPILKMDSEIHPQYKLKLKLTSSGKRGVVKLEGTTDENVTLTIGTEKYKNIIQSPELEITENLKISAQIIPPDSITLHFPYDHPYRDKPLKENKPPTVENYKNLEKVSAEFKEKLSSVQEFVDNIDPNIDPYEVTLVGRASLPGTLEYNKGLAQRRIEVGMHLIKFPAGLDVKKDVVGETGSTDPERYPEFQSVVFTAEQKDIKLNAKIVTGPPPDATRNTTEISTKMPDPPDVIRQLGIKFKMIRNVPTLIELHGKLDFGKKLVENLDKEKTGEVEIDKSGCGTDFLEEGRVDFKLAVTHNISPPRWEEYLQLSSGQNTTEGILKYECKENNSELLNIIGALLVAAPIIGEVAKDFDSDDGGDWVALGISLAVPVLLGGLSVVKVTKIVLHGGEIVFMQDTPSNAGDTFSRLGLALDYAVAFNIDIVPEGTKILRTTQPIKVRYKAIGFELNFKKSQYRPIFDTSKGYELDISDPGLFALIGPLNDLLQIQSTKLQKVNPLFLEFDLGIKVDLGFISVDKFKIKWELPTSAGQEIKAPIIIPSGVSVDLEGVLTGSGYVNIENHPAGKTIEGALDVTLTSIKLRIAADLKVQPIEDGNRKATAVYASLLVEFPAAIVLGTTGLGIFGIVGIFAMHFKRDETDRVPGESVGPALKWLARAKGEPNTLLDESGGSLWVSEFDRWSFGVGIKLGTLEGGTLINLWGTFMLELPGPRIIIFIKINIISELPSKEDAKDLTVGILGVLDLDFQRGHITVGVIVDFEIEELIKIQLPVELFFDLNNARNWHLYLGTHKQMAGADILGIVKGYSYFMIEGNEIVDYPPMGNGNFPGIALAFGLEAAIFYGYPAINLYLKVAAGAHIAMSFYPRIGFFGQVFIEGELMLIIVGVGVRASLTAYYLQKEKEGEQDELFIEGKVCGRVSFLFFTIEECISIKFGNTDQIPENKTPPQLISNVFLQSYAPVLTSGQGGDRPIDGSLGDAVLDINETMPVVPIDSNIIIQMVAPPVVDNAIVLGSPFHIHPPNFRDDGWVSIGAGKKVKYELSSIELSPTISGDNVVVPSSKVWRKDLPQGLDQQSNPPNKNSNTGIDLALLTRTPSNSGWALERSSSLETTVKLQWQDLCVEDAPPACVLFPLCQQFEDATAQSWMLHGIAYPDPPGLRRTTDVKKSMLVEAPSLTTEDGISDSEIAQEHGIYEFPARIISHPERDCKQVLELPTALHIPRNTFFNLPEERKEKHALLFHTGKCQKVAFFLAIKNAQLEIVEYTANRQRIRSFIPNFPNPTPPTVNYRAWKINKLTDLPLTWHQTESPWSGVVNDAYSFLGNPLLDDATNVRKSHSFEPLFLEFAPTEHTEIVEIRLHQPDGYQFYPRVLVLDIELCSTSEFLRLQEVKKITESRRKMLKDFMEKGTEKGKEDLLEPDTIYTLTIKYKARISDEEGKVVDLPEESIKYFFKTDNKPPGIAGIDPSDKVTSQLSSYILGTTPDDNDSYHFYEDPIEIAFNGPTIFEIIRKYKKSLRFEFRRADGKSIKDGVSTNPPPEVTYLDYNSPYWDTLAQRIAQGKLPCTDELVPPSKRGIPLPATLQPQVEYILEIHYGDVMEGSSISVFPTPSDSNLEPPLFRRNFRTSKYKDIVEIADSFASSKIEYSVLENPDALKVTTTEDVTRISDDEMQQLLLNTGEEAPPPATSNIVKLLWKTSNVAASELVGILIDSEEPIWKWREEPKLTPVKSEDNDPKFQVLKLQQVPSLGLVEVGPNDNICKFIVSHGGTRTLIILQGIIRDLTICIRQYHSSLFSKIKDRKMPLITLPNLTAPWDYDS